MAWIESPRREGAGAGQPGAGSGGGVGGDRKLGAARVEVGGVELVEARTAGIEVDLHSAALRQMNGEEVGQASAVEHVSPKGRDGGGDLQGDLDRVDASLDDDGDRPGSLDGQVSASVLVAPVCGAAEGEGGLTDIGSSRQNEAEGDAIGRDGLA